MLKTVTYNTETHKVVPIEPDRMMQDAAFTALRLANPSDIEIWTEWKNVKGEKVICVMCETLIYKAMLKAAPEFEGEK